MFSARADYFVGMKQNKLVISHQHRIGMHVGTTLTGSFCAIIVNQLWERIINRLALKKVQHIFWSLFFLHPSRNAVSFLFAYAQDQLPGKKQFLVFFKSVPNDVVYAWWSR